MGDELHFQWVTLHRTGSDPGPVSDRVCVEEPLEIVLRFQQNGTVLSKTLAITMRTPGQDEALVRGLLFNEGILSDPQRDIDHLEFRYDCTASVRTQQTVVVHLRNGLIPDVSHVERNLITSSSCGVCGRTALDRMLDQCIYLPRTGLPLIQASTLYTLPEKLLGSQEAFRQTGGIHGCALFDTGGNIQLHAEDVGRHNAMDKLCGMAHERSLVPVSNQVILVSGRASFELVHKACMIGCAVLASIGAASSMAIETAETFGMTLVGFLRKDRANIYTHPERVAI
ncbi:MAG: Sulfur carrier protein FdhD [Saprospiraceae bacterium]|jgi:FdhD protein|nr:Sulfur carrier protein FdhD [Saprospiraceae bacterium]